MHCSHFIELNVTLFKWFNYNLIMYEADVVYVEGDDDSFAITLWVVYIIYLENEIQRHFETK